MNQRDEDEDRAWRDIVDNYGEPPVFDAPAPPEPEPVHQPEPVTEWNPTPWEDEGRFVPPAPDPIPLAEPRRLIAWGGLVASPLILLLVVVFGWELPSWIISLLIVWFVGGFGYLVWNMQTGPRDPGDDGARL